MINGRRADTSRRRQRVLAALDAAPAAGDDSTSPGIARRAGVDRTFLYRHRDLLDRLHAATTQRRQAQHRARRHPRLAASRPARRPATLRTYGRPNPQLETRLSELLGEQAWREPDSAHPTTSTGSSNTSSPSSNKSSICDCNSKNATKTSPPHAPPTANSWPSPTHPGRPDDTPAQVLAPHLLRTISFRNQPQDLRKRGKL